MKRTILAALGVVLLLTGVAVAQTYPSNPNPATTDVPSDKPDVDVDVQTNPPDVDVDISGDTDADTSAQENEPLIGDTDPDTDMDTDADNLPATASELPLVGSIGLLALAAAIGLRVVAKRK